MYKLDFSKPIQTEMFGRMKQTKGWEHTGRVLVSHLLVFVIDGNADFVFNNTGHEVIKGECVFIPANTYYTANTQSICEYFFFHFMCDIYNINDNTQTPQTIESPVYSFSLPEVNYDCILLDEKMCLSKYYEIILNMIITCHEYTTNFTCTNRLLFDVQFSKILIVLSDYLNMGAKEQNPSELLRKVILYIQKNYTKQISLRDLSEKFSVSKSYIARLFKKNLNTSAITYINNFKLDHAVMLLKNSNMNINEISEYLGYSDCFYFSRIFKKRFLVSPTKYEKR